MENNIQKVIIAAAIFFYCGGFLFAADKNIKEPNVAGAFYPAERGQLRSIVEKFINEADPPKIDGDIVAIISPHAGYIYSGRTAGFAYKAIEGRAYKTVIIIAPSHYANFEGAAVFDKDAYKTPLGAIDADKDFINSLTGFDGKTVRFMAEAFEKEHSMEVELPFAQVALKDFKIVPIITGALSYWSAEKLADALYKTIAGRKDCLIIISTDMSHYHPYEEANNIDSLTIKYLKGLDNEKLFDSIISGECELCGAFGVVTAILYAKKANAKIELLKYETSGDTTGDKSKVVGYSSFAIYKGGEVQVENRKLNDGQRKRLLEIARQTVESLVKNGKVLEFSETDPELLKEKGAFVTLHHKGQLRGCIGNIVGQGPLFMTIRNMAVESSMHDARFAPVRQEELKDIDIEISVLSVPEKVDDPDKIIMGKHGVIVKLGDRGGVFLPQVATEQGWGREEFLNNLCSQKAGLPEDAWKKGAQLFIFSAEVFGEKE